VLTLDQGKLTGSKKQKTGEPSRRTSHGPLAHMTLQAERKGKERSASPPQHVRSLTDAQDREEVSRAMIVAKLSPPSPVKERKTPKEGELTPRDICQAELTGSTSRSLRAPIKWCRSPEVISGDNP